MTKQRVGHTKGPWGYEFANKCDIRPINTPEVLLASVNFSFKAEGEAEANAALIAAAPELLKAVKKAYSMTAPLSTYGRELAALIAKAEGEA